MTKLGSRIVQTCRFTSLQTLLLLNSLPAAITQQLSKLSGFSCFFTLDSLEVQQISISFSLKSFFVTAVGKPDAGKYCCATAGNKAYCVMLVVKMPPAPAAKTSPAIYVAVVVLVVFVVAVIGFCVYKRYKSRSTERYGLLNDPVSL